MMLAPLQENRARTAVVKPGAIPAPVAGWDASTAFAAMKPNTAVQLKNWFPQPGYVEMRRGYASHATGVGISTADVESLFPWNGPASRKMFASAGGTIYDVTSAGAASATAVTGQTNNRWQWANFATSAGNFVFFVNGADAPWHYNGTNFVNPSITGITAADIIHVNVHKKRLWFVLKDSTKAAYLPTEAVAGAATTFELGSVFSEGGHLMAMATWTRDGGAGSDDFAAFISSRGQVAIYQGTDPASALTWDLVGVFRVGAPIGRRCFVNWGSDVLLITMSGVYPLSQLLAVDASQQELRAITQRISNAINTAARANSANFGWELNVYPRGTRLMLNIPTTEDSVSIQYVMNTLTGAWCEFDGINALCWLTFNDLQYFGGGDGTVYKADTTSKDGSSTITYVGQCAWNPFSDPGRLKQFSMVQPLIKTQGAARPSLGISVDFVETTSLSTPSAAVAAQAQWGSGTWGTSLWGSDDVFVSDWTSTPALGRFASVKFRATANSTSETLMQINGFIVLMQPGAYV